MAGLHLRPMIHVADIAASIAFYRQLGAEVVHGDQDSTWVLLQLGTVQVGLLAGGPPGVELHFDSAMPLDELERHLHRAGYPVAEVTSDRDFGEQLRVRTPDGQFIKISQRESGA